eukprot:5352301-Pleurochrysis_carterae.AAC.5
MFGNRGGAFVGQSALVKNCAGATVPCSRALPASDRPPWQRDPHNLERCATECGLRRSWVCGNLRRT